MSQLKKHLKFKTKHFIRQFIYYYRLKFFGKNIFIDDNVKFLRYPGNISLENNVIIKEGARLCSCNEEAMVSIGKRTTVGYHVFIFASNNIKIGSDCLIAPFVYIVDSNHSIKKGVLINTQPNKTSPITIGNDVWIASNVTILMGVSIGSGSIIAANSLVNSDVGQNEIWGGTPAKKIGIRD